MEHYSDLLQTGSERTGVSPCYGSFRQRTGVVQTVLSATVLRKKNEGRRNTGTRVDRREPQDPGVFSGQSIG